MTMSGTLYRYLADQEVAFDLLTHPHSTTSLETARLAHVPADCVAKPVLLEDEQGYLMAVIPASHRLDLGELDRQLNRHLEFAPEAEIAGLFEDCEPGAMPPLGAPWGIPEIVDDRLAEQAEVWFEAGDHEQLVHMNGETFAQVIGDARFGRFSEHL